MKSLPFRIENGRKVYTLDCVVDSQRLNKPVQPSATPPENTDNSDGEESAEEVHADGLVRDEWRLISCVQAWPSTGFWLPQMVDYSHDDGKVLKQAVSLVNSSQPDLCWNHSVDAKDVAGHIENARWEKSGDIPWGVNATLVVDPEYDAKAAKGLAGGHIRNGSIGLSMEVDPSHPNMPEEKFYEMQGEKVDGEVVRWLPKKIHAVRHMAMLAAGTGADPNAGKRAMANSRVENKKEEKVESMDKIIVLLTTILGKLGIDAVITENSEMPETLAEKVENKLAALVEVATKYNELAAAVQAFGCKLGENLTALQTIEALPALYELSECGKRLVEFKAAEVLGWFDKAKFSPDKTELTESEKRLRSRIEASKDLDYLEDLLCEYKAQAEAKFPDARRSSETPALPVDGATKTVAPSPDIVDSSKKMFGPK